MLILSQVTILTECLIKWCSNQFWQSVWKKVMLKCWENEMFECKGNIDERKYWWWLRELMTERTDRRTGIEENCSHLSVCSDCLSPCSVRPYTIAKTYYLSWYICTEMAKTCHLFSCCTRAGIVETYHLSSWNSRTEIIDNAIYVQSCDERTIMQRIYNHATCVQSCKAVIEMRCGLGKLQTLRSD